MGLWSGAEGRLGGHLHALAADVHLDQRVSHQVSEAAGVEVAVGPRVVAAVVDLRELQASVAVEVLAVEVLVGAADLQRGGRLVRRRRRRSLLLPCSGRF